MNFSEYLKENNVETAGRIVSGEPWGNLNNIIGQEVWICDYRLNEKKELKPIRNVPPKLVRVVSNDELPRSKSVFYSDIHFREVKNGKLLSTVIAPYDNTGFRCYAGISVRIFYSREECFACYVKEIKTAIGQYCMKTDEIINKSNDLRCVIKEYMVKGDGCDGQAK